MKFRISFLAVAIALLPISSLRADQKKLSPLWVPPLLGSNPAAAQAEVNMGIDRLKTGAPSLSGDEVARLVEPRAALLERDFAR
jgi:hypothetical protein